jgi:hypothetical protein
MQNERTLEDFINHMDYLERDQCTLFKKITLYRYESTTPVFDVFRNSTRMITSMVRNIPYVHREDELQDLAICNLIIDRLTERVPALFNYAMTNCLPSTYQTIREISRNIVEWQDRLSFAHRDKIHIEAFYTLLRNKCSKQELDACNERFANIETACAEQDRQTFNARMDGYIRDLTIHNDALIADMALQRHQYIARRNQRIALEEQEYNERVRRQQAINEAENRERNIRAYQERYRQIQELFQRLFNHGVYFRQLVIANPFLVILFIGVLLR